MEELIGKIERTPLRDVWRHEAHNFTTWLADNLDVVGEAIGLDLTLVEREAPAGAFSVDLLAESADARTVIIENQLEKSDHDHLGKVLTYLAAYEASTAVWIVAEPRPEHTKAVAWLNDSSSASVHLLRAEAVRIEGSPAALLLTSIISPSEEGTEVARHKQEKSERHTLHKDFWIALLEQSATKTGLLANVSPGEQNWLGQSAGRSGLALNYVIRQHDWNVQLYIDTGDGGVNRRYFDWLANNRSAIDKDVGDELDWEPLEERRACRIKTPWNPGGYRSDPQQWPALHEKMIDTMIRFESALRPHLDRLPSFEHLNASTDGAT